MSGNVFSGLRTTIVTMLAGMLLISAVGQPVGTATPPTQRDSSASARAGNRYRPQTASRARDYYQLIWGVDSLSVKSVESGEMIRFSYRVIDPKKAALLNDKKEKPWLIDRAANVKLEIPTLEKVGQLRQVADPEAGRVYWMVFSNKRRPVKVGDRVSVVIGNFHADELLVQ